eukprot:CAMPEP_0184856106 /NCGR_PEP_ID=MMETSP0580-20130426/1283_1 /TAXON_ID=1118495 /ORGANISM="Dactyliosolen fragilissimus" /LENGTH=144 /DNA_ID=CAMNT_0027350925 /DNA_START=87 /DNA_END=521 /DNA_ORIENTATION=+
MISTCRSILGNVAIISRSSLFHPSTNGYLEQRIIRLPTKRYLTSSSDRESMGKVMVTEDKNSADINGTEFLPKVTQDDGNNGSCSNGFTRGEEDDEMEFEDMFVEAHPTLGHDRMEWGGPRRGGRFDEPTRFGDWERKGRCTDF